MGGGKMEGMRKLYYGKKMKREKKNGSGRWDRKSKEKRAVLIHTTYRVRNRHNALSPQSVFR